MRLNAYYFRAQLYTLVPRQVDEDLAWMADLGTAAVTVGVLEQDLYHAVENLACIAEAAERHGLKFWVTPSRWAGLVAGCPKVPSLFAATHPETWIRDEAGAPVFNLVHGPMASVHADATRDFFLRNLERLFSLLPVAGIVWDEIKIVDVVDRNPAARRALPEPDPDAHRQATADFFGEISRAAKALQPGLSTAVFLFADLPDRSIAPFAGQPSIDIVGVDGRPWAAADGGRDDNGTGAAPGKLLVDHGPKAIALAERHGKESLFLIENHALAAADLPLMDRRLPEIVAMRPDHLLYYYYPRSVEDPDAAMAIVARHLRGAGDRPGGEPA